MKLQDLYEAEEKSFKDVFGDMSSEKYHGEFSCADKKLTSLEGSPIYVRKHFWCGNNRLTDLKGSPTEIGGSFIAGGNPLASLEGAPKITGSNFWCNQAELTSLHNIHKDIKKISGKFNMERNEIKSHVLGLLLIEGITVIVMDNKIVEGILNIFLRQGRAGLIDCAEKLIKAGYPEMAKL